jgi:hypothetical protein
MPFGPSLLGFTYFVGIKAGGYCAAAGVLNRLYADTPGPAQQPALAVGLTRTAIGITAGVTYGALWIAANIHSASLYLAGLLPIRLAEWLALIWIFYDRPLVLRTQDAKAIAGGTVWSYVLDAIGIGAAFVLPGGMWVC